MTHEELRRKARYGHRAYLYWTNWEGVFCFAPYGKAGLKAAILDVGAKRRRETTMIGSHLYNSPRLSSR